MTLFVLAFIIICLCALGSLFRLAGKLHPLEIVNYLLFSGAVSQQIFSVISLNMGRIWFVEVSSVFWILELGRVIIFPSLLVWFIYGMLVWRKQPLKQIIFLAWWLLLSIGIEHAYPWLGLVEFRDWSALEIIVKELTRLGLVFTYVFLFRRLLRKEGSLA